MFTKLALGEIEAKNHFYLLILFSIFFIQKWIIQSLESRIRASKLDGRNQGGVWTNERGSGLLSKFLLGHNRLFRNSSMRSAFANSRSFLSTRFASRARSASYSKGNVVICDL